MFINECCPWIPKVRKCHLHLSFSQYLFWTSAFFFLNTLKRLYAWNKASILYTLSVDYMGHMYQFLLVLQGLYDLPWSWTGEYNLTFAPRRNQLREKNSKFIRKGRVKKERKDEKERKRGRKEEKKEKRKKIRKITPTFLSPLLRMCLTCCRRFFSKFTEGRKSISLRRIHRNKLEF